MKLNNTQISRAIAEKIMLESPTFRSLVLDMFYDSQGFIAEVKAQLVPNNKIASIKAVREFTKNRVAETHDAFPGLNLEFYCYEGQASTLGLGSAKLLVETLMP